ncbi:hypothetical protein PT7_0520 [Pusillimonas sp. T7-7]|nr:hypothetical protein PT7_0520 [Pusillimonas sp. T7-7]
MWAPQNMAPIERHYECSICKTVWTRLTDSDGVDKEFRVARHACAP